MYNDRANIKNINIQIPYQFTSLHASRPNRDFINDDWRPTRCRKEKEILRL